MERLRRFLLFLSLLTAVHCFCDPSQSILLSLAFSSVSGYHPPPSTSSGNCIRELRLPSQSLSGSVSWMLLRNITTLQTLDLSGNALEGSIPSGFWSIPSLAAVNLAGNNFGGPLRFDPTGRSGLPGLRFLNFSGNRFTAVTGLSALGGLRVLDISRNRLGLVPTGSKSLPRLEYLDVSGNSMTGEFPGDFPAISALRLLNVSFNNLTGEVDSGALEKFGNSAFVKAGNLTYGSSSTAKQSGDKHKKGRALRMGVITAAAAAGVLVIGLAIAGALWCRRRRKRKDRAEEERGTAAAAAEEASWVAEARSGAAVVIFEKPLMGLTFGDLAAATSGFGRESLIAEGGRSGPVYRAVLPGEMHVVVRVMESARDVEENEAAAAFREIAQLRHPNLLPLIGFCISGREKLLLYEYMERADLRRWLHELPAGNPNVEDCSGDTWDNLPSGSRSSSAAAAAAGHWPTRHRIALGVARGLAFLHQEWVGSRAPVVHGHLIPSNILLSDDLSPRISDFALPLLSPAGGAVADEDVYNYGVVVMELVTGQERWSDEEVERVRATVRDRRAASAIDPRLQLDAEWEKEAAECLRVSYLCTAPTPSKRPAMQQVVALLKDIRPAAAFSSSC